MQRLWCVKYLFMSRHRLKSPEYDLRSNWAKAGPRVRRVMNY